MMMAEKDKIKKLLERGAEEIIERTSLENKLKKGNKLRIKFGIDPTGDVIHLGHSVCLLKLKEFQELGHQVIFLIGDFTARIGDPTGRTVSRVPLSRKEIEKNMESYKEQAGLILNMGKVEVRYNSEWLDKLNFQEMMILASKVTYGQVSRRADFKKRLAEDQDFTLEEFMYPVLQGYDSVRLESDVEVGGTDQKFNMLMGRRIQKRYKQEPQDVLTCPLLEGTDGKEKMSKSLGNFVALKEEPGDMFGKIMSIPDPLIKRYFELLTEVRKEKAEDLFEKGPYGAKSKLAEEIVKIYHGEKKAVEARDNFVSVFQKGEIPEDAEGIKTKENTKLKDILADNSCVSSVSEFRRLIKEGAIEFEGEKIDDVRYKIKKSGVVRIGKKKFVKLEVS